MQGIKAHQSDGGGTVGVGDDATVVFEFVPIYFRNDQRNGGIHAKGGTVVDDHATMPFGFLRKLHRVFRSGTEYGHVQVLEGLRLGFLHGFQVPASLHFPTGGAGGGKQFGLGDGKVSLFKQTDDFLTYGSSGADDSNTIFFQ